MGLFRGQGATEYLVLLAVVLIVALVSVALLGFFPGMATDARMTQSQAYWKGQARPFAILDSQISGSTGAGSFVLQNMEAVGPYTIWQLSVGSGTNNTSVSFGAGETKIIGLNTTASGAAASTYDLNVTITYQTPTGLNNSKQYSTKNLIGKFT
jgi:hypothetical protein